jgi:hypothetical protein
MPKDRRSAIAGARSGDLCRAGTEEDERRVGPYWARFRELEDMACGVAGLSRRTLGTSSDAKSNLLRVLFLRGELSAVVFREKPIETQQFR